MTNTICLLDISGFIYRAYYAMPQFNYKGQEVGALFGFCSEMLNMLSMFPNAIFMAALDCSRTTFRTEIYPEYKANRSQMPTDLISQRNLIPDCCERFGFIVAQKQNYEADDIIASYTKYYHSTYKIIVISSDKDLLQLLDFCNVKFYNPSKRKFINNNDVFNKFGVLPNKLLDVFALVGDSSDNVPGISGVGPKTASKLINQYGSLEGLIENLETLSNSKQLLKIKTQIHYATLSKKLIELKYNLDLNYENIQPTKPKDLLGYFTLYGFDSLIKRLDKLHIN